MEAPSVPRSVIAFLRSYIDHTLKLRFIVLLHTAPSNTTSVSFAARSLDVPPSQLREIANELAQRDLVRINNDHIELAPIAIDERLALAELASWYTRDRAGVLAMVSALVTTTG